MSATNLSPGVTGCGGKYCVDCGTVHRPDTGDLASAQLEIARLRADLERVTEERDSARELLASTVAQCEREQAERWANAAALAHAVVSRDRAEADLESEQEALDAIRSALDRRDLCYTCAAPREGHSKALACTCAGTMCVGCCAET